MVLGLSGCLVLGMVVMNDHARSALQTNKELASHSPSTLYISLLGGFHLVYGVHTLSADQIHLHKARDMLKLLALSPNQRLHREELLEMLWPEHAPNKQPIISAILCIPCDLNLKLWMLRSVWILRMSV